MQASWDSWAGRVGVRSREVSIAGQQAVVLADS